MTFFKTFHFSHHILETFKIRKIRKKIFCNFEKNFTKISFKGLVDAVFQNINRGIFVVVEWHSSGQLEQMSEVDKLAFEKNENDLKS